MTRTQKLNLFTWQLSDPVDLSQMNENFTLLDKNGCRTEAALWNSAIGLLAAEHAGYATVCSESAFADALRNTARISSYEQICFGQRGAALLTEGEVGRSFLSDNIEIVDRTATLVDDFRPQGYGMLTEMTLYGVHNQGLGRSVTLYVYAGTELVAQSSQQIQSSAQAFTLHYSFSCELDPNKTYSIKATTGAESYASVQAINLALTASAQTYTTGSFQTASFAVPSGASRLRLMCSTSGMTPDISLADADDDWIPLELDAQAFEGVNRYTAQTVLPSGLQTVRLKFDISGAGKALHDYAFILF